MGSEDDDEDPSMKKSDKVGIKNLGATCYLNTLLQIWFYNHSVRRFIYSYQPGINQTQNVVMLLQSLFAQMQSSKAPWIDARPLVEMLDLRSHIQQDSLEFSKLLGSLLETVLSASSSNSTPIDSHGHSSSPPLSKMFAEEFKGFFRYTTTCCHCNTENYREAEFAELEVSIPPNGSLLDAINDSLSQERLTGSNKYQCGRCETLRDALRSTQLRIIPPTLQIQVNRFVFDMKTLTKKKSNKSINFPASINMSRYTSFKKGVKEDKWYDLSAVLLHRGTSASSGHYICRVFDQENKQWLNCDDDIVSIMDPPNFQLKESLDGGGASSGDTASTANNSKKCAFTPDNSDVVEIDPPSSADPSYSASTFAAPTDSVSVSDFKSTAAYMLCYTARSSVKYPDVPTRISNSIAQANAIMEQDIAEQEKKEANIVLRKTALRKEFEELYACWKKNPQDLNNTMDLVLVPSETLSKAIKRVTSGLYEDADEDLVEPATVNISCSEIMCDHNKLSPTAFSQAKVITERGYDRLTQMGFVVDQKLMARDWCFDCFKETLNNLVESHLHALDLAVASNGRETKEKYGISKKWFQEWKKKIPFDGKVPDPLSEPFRSDVYCVHGGIATDNSKIQFISKNVYAILQLRYGYSGPEQDESRCAGCVTIDQENTLEDYERQEKKESVSDLKRLLTGKQIDPEVGSIYYLFPKSFLDEWKQFVKSKVVMEKPVLETNSLLCADHQKIKCQLPGRITGSSKKSSNDCVLVDEEEWNELVRLYGKVDTPLQIIPIALEDSSAIGEWKIVHGKVMSNDSPSALSFDSSPNFCDECKEVEELNYKKAIVFVIKRSTPGSQETTPNVPDSSDIEISQKDDQKRTATDFFRPQKRSRTRTVQKKRERAQLTVKPDLTVRAMKESLVARFKVPPIYQKLFINGQEVLDDQTMRQLKVKAGAEFEIEIFDQDAYDLDGYGDDGESALEYGFTGTKLSGSIPKGSIWECPACTLLNDAHLVCCAVCATKKPAQC